MFTSKEFGTALVRAVAQLKTIEAALGELDCPKITELTINLSALSKESIDELLEEIPTGYKKDDKGTDFVYVIQVAGGNEQLVSLLQSQCEAARASAKDYSRVNHEHRYTNTIYVGRSKTLRARLSQHLGEDGDGVFSLHLQRWALTVDAQVHIYIMPFKDTDDLLVQAIEDGIWTSLRPAFGRKGEK